MSKEKYKTYIRQILSKAMAETPEASVQDPRIVDWLAENQGRKFPHLNGDENASEDHIREILNSHPVPHTPATAVAAIHAAAIEDNPRVEESIWDHSPEKVTNDAPSKEVVLENEDQHAYNLQTDLEKHLSKLKGNNT